MYAFQVVGFNLESLERTVRGETPFVPRALRLVPKTGRTLPPLTPRPKCKDSRPSQTIEPTLATGGAMTKTSIRLAVGFVTLFLGAMSRSEAAQVEESACHIDGFETPVRCVRFEVPRDYDEPNGETLTLTAVIVPALTARPAPDPLIALAGGPGQAASGLGAAIEPAFGRVRRTRDIVLFDIRGAGLSPRACLRRITGRDSCGAGSRRIGDFVRSSGADEPVCARLRRPAWRRRARKLVLRGRAGPRAISRDDGLRAHQYLGCFLRHSDRPTLCARPR